MSNSELQAFQYLYAVICVLIGVIVGGNFWRWFF